MANPRNSGGDVDRETVRERERQYRDGVDISEDEVLAKFEADGFDREAVRPHLAQRDQASEEG